MIFDSAFDLPYTFFMLAATHAITGAALAKISPYPTMGYFLALLSHPLLDYIPHWDLRTRHSNRTKSQVIIFSLIDAFLGFAIGIILFGKSVPLYQLVLTMLLAQLPDWLEAPYTIFNWKFPPFSWIKSFQHQIHNKLPFPDGLFTQLIVIFFFLLISSS